MKNKKGFTLVEMLAVIVILGILISLSTVAIVNIKKKQDVNNLENTISSILTGSKKYFVEHSGVNEVSVSTLLTVGDVDFDREKFENLVSLSVIKENCSTDPHNPSLKSKVKFSYDGKTYNDCGCTKQDSTLKIGSVCTE